jgi:predicted heme/steroid binding protein
MAIIFACFAVSIIFAGCEDNKDPLDNPEELEQWPEGLNVYVAGFEEIQDNPAARLWKNGTVQNLVGSRQSRSTAIKTEAHSVFVSGNDVYVAGRETYFHSYYAREVTQARLWKNGEMQNLNNEAFSDGALAVFVSGNDVYVLISEVLDPEIHLLDPDQNRIRQFFKIWKNGEEEVFAEGGNNCRVNSFFVSNGDVYVIGRRTTPSGFQATLWKNGVEETLVCESYRSEANSIFVSGNDVYIAGNRHVYHTSTATLWKNGVAESLSDENKSGEAYSVFVSGSDVYVAGREWSEAKFWKNGIEQDIADGEDALMYLSVFVKDNDVYLAGYAIGIQEVPPGSGIIPFNYLKATLWRNGKKLNLKTNESNSRAFSVFVQ